MESIFYVWIILAILTFFAGLFFLFIGSADRTSGALIGVALISPPIVMLISFLAKTSGYPFIYSIYLGIVGVLIGVVLMIRERKARVLSLRTLPVLIGIGCLSTIAYLNHYFSNLP